MTELDTKSALGSVPGRRSPAAKRIVVLIADDEPVTRMVLAGGIGQEYDVIQAVDGQDALEKYAAHRPDILLLDVQMPRLDGCQVCERIRAQAQEAHVPVLLMSAQNDEELVLEGLARGADDFVFKPVNQRVLLSKLRAQIARKNSSDQIAVQRQRLLELQQETAREHFAASAVLRNIVGRAELNHPSIRHMLSPMSGFDGDVALAARLPTGSLRIMVSDVVGHGLPAALGTIPIAVLFYTSTRRGVELGSALDDMSRELCGILPVGLFASAAAFEVTPDGRQLRVWNGGIPDLLLRRRDSTELIHFASENIPLGITTEAPSVVRELEVSPGDVLFVFSDGVSEARSMNGEMFGMQRVVELLSADHPVDQLFDDLRSALMHFCQDRQDDDITMLAHTVGG
jgi:CheY-like chemotaxis protein